MKEDLIKYKQMLEAEKGKEKRYYIIKIEALPQDPTISHDNRKHFEILKNYLDQFNTTVTLSAKQNNNPIPADIRCENYMKECIDFFVSNKLPLNSIELFSELYLLVDAEGIEKLKEEKDLIQKEIDYIEKKYSKFAPAFMQKVYPQIEKFWNDFRKNISPYILNSHVYLDLIISRRSGLWGYNRIMNQTPVNTINTINENPNYNNEEIANELQKLIDNHFTGVVNLEEFVRKMEENGYEITLENYNSISDPTIYYYIYFFMNEKTEATLQILANLFTNEKRKK